MCRLRKHNQVSRQARKHGKYAFNCFDYHYDEIFFKIAKPIDLINSRKSGKTSTSCNCLGSSKRCSRACFPVDLFIGLAGGRVESLTLSPDDLADVSLCSFVSRTLTTCLMRPTKLSLSEGSFAQGVASYGLGPLDGSSSLIMASSESIAEPAPRLWARKSLETS